MWGSRGDAEPRRRHVRPTGRFSLSTVRQGQRVKEWPTPTPDQTSLRLRASARTKGPAPDVRGSSPAPDRVQDPRDACPDPVRHRHDADRRCPLSARLGGIRAGDQGAASEPLCRARSADPAGNLVEPRLRRDLWRAGRDRRLGLAESRLDANLCRRPSLAALVLAGLGAALSDRARHLVLLDASLDAPARRLQGRARRPSRQPTADRLGRHGLSSDRSGDGRCGNSATCVSDSDPHRRTRLGADHHDRYGRDQPHGLGDLSAIPVAGAPGGVAHHRKPSSTAS